MMEIYSEKDPFEYVRTYYGVKAYKGRKIKFKGKEVEIVGASGPRLKVRGKDGTAFIHPTWEVEYPE